MKKTRKKLQLNRETLRVLNLKVLENVAGAYFYTANCPTNESCTGLCKCKVTITEAP